MAMQAAGGILQGAAAIGSLFKKSNNSAQAAATQYNYNLALQKQAQDWQEKMYGQRYQMQRKDLEAAGINPLYGLGTAPMMTSGANSVGMPETVSEMSSKKQQMLEAANMLRNWSAQAVQMEKTKAETVTEYLNGQLKVVEKANAELDNLYKKGELGFQGKRQKAELEALKSSAINNIEQAGEARARAGTARAQEQQIREMTVPQTITNKWHKRHPAISGLATGTKEIAPVLNVLGTIIGGAAGAAFGVGKFSTMGNAAKTAGRANSAMSAIKKANRHHN